MNNNMSAPKCEVQFALGPSAREVRYTVLEPPSEGGAAGAGAGAGAEATAVGSKYAWRLVPSVHRITVSGLGPRVTKFRVPEISLPFGLLEMVRVEGLPPGARLRLTLTKSTGVHMCDLSEGTRWRAGMGLEDTEFANANDAADVHLQLVKRETGHVMAWRMLAAASIGRMEVELCMPPFAPDTPPKLTLVCLGANAVGAEVEDDALGDGRRQTLLLPPMTNKARFEHLEATGPTVK